MQGDRRQIQTAVMGSADSEEPLMLPLEAIELDAFRRRHGDDTFWCGLLLGGCGGQLTTKLYTDRVCHFAHHPGPDGLPHVCGRRARGVASADHLYVKSAAAAWLRGRDDQADFDLARPDGAAIGSVVDIRFKTRGLRVHLDQAVEPMWDEDSLEPVLGVSVPVDQETLIRRWYVHRIRLNSEGTTRRVRIGTEAFARPTEWFGLNECEMTERGLSTPMVEQIVRSRSTPPPSRWTAVEIKSMPATEARRRLLFFRLDKAVTARDTKQVRRLLHRAKVAASSGRTEKENNIADAAADYLAERVQNRRNRATVQKNNAEVANEAGATVEQPRTTGRTVALHEKVARRFWIRRACPVCNARPGQVCVEQGEGGGKGVEREHGHNERIMPIAQEREVAAKAKAAQRAEDQRTLRGTASMVPGFRLLNVSCPVCHARPDQECALTVGAHQLRKDIFFRRLRGSDRHR
ncbi:hypothetical protein ACFYWN_37655 [Streptomyces sp. NPDC002917]|uniref:zinc finger domain-containing protein n=1 Tax=Streptomyces sp. NPDC002917 TaxID=3364671 RepID=UPI0036C536BF